jgi:hypothetical protein
MTTLGDRVLGLVMANVLLAFVFTPWQTTLRVTLAAAGIFWLTDLCAAWLDRSAGSNGEDHATQKGKFTEDHQQ